MPRDARSLPAPDLTEFYDPAVNPNRGSKCGVLLAFNAVTDEQADKLRAALASEAIPHATVARVVTGWGCRLTAESVSRHRKKECACRPI